MTALMLNKMQALFGLRTDLDLNVGLRYSLSASLFYPGQQQLVRIQ
jgi:hypothetical protein